jgi:amphi-Trp domain-containing protein
MPKRRAQRRRDVEKAYPVHQFVAKLRRLIECIEKRERFQISVAGKRVSVPPTAIVCVEHERGSETEELEFQLKWPVTS